MQNEIKIYKAKVERVDPIVAKSIPKSKLALSKDKKLKNKLKKNTHKKKYEAVTDVEFLDNVFDDVSIASDIFLDLNYFSQYISSIGFRFSIDLLFNFDPSMIYVVVCSINPPGSLYQENSSADKIVVYNEINFGSKIKGQRFKETFYMFVNLPVNHRSHLVVDIKSIKFKRKGPTEVKDYAWTVFPIFSTLDVDDDMKTIEIFVRSGIYMMPMIQGAVRNDIVQQLVHRESAWGYLNEQLKTRIAPISLLPKAGTIVR